MGTSISSLSDAVVTVVLIAMFVMVFVVARQALKDLPLFGDRGGWMVAVCVAALSVIGLLRFFGSPGQAPVASEPRNGDGVLTAILLPYVVLTLSALLVLFLLALGKWLPARSEIPRDRWQAKPAPKGEMLTKQRQTKPQESLRKRLEK